MTKTYPFPNETVAAVLDRYYSGVQFSGGVVSGDNLPSDEEFSVKVAEYSEAKRIIGIKTKAGEIILARYPSWKQQNLQARFTELVDKVQGGEALTSQEQQEKDGIKAAWAWAKLVRAESDRLEADMNATPNWPV